MSLVGRGNQGRGKSRNRVGGGNESNVRDVEKGMGWSKGGHQVQAAMTATVAHQRHRRRCFLTPAGDPSPHTSPHNVISRTVTQQLHREREINRPCATLHLAHAPSARRLEDATTCLRPHSLPTPHRLPSTKTRPQKNPSLHPSHNTPRLISRHLTLPAFFKQTARPVKET